MEILLSEVSKKETWKLLYIFTNLSFKIYIESNQKATKNIYNRQEFGGQKDLVIDDETFVGGKILSIKILLQ